MVVLFGVFVRYEADADAHWADSKAQHNTSDLENEFYYRYPSKSGHPAGPPEAPPPPQVPAALPTKSPASLLGNRGREGAGAGETADAPSLGAPWSSPLSLPNRAPASLWRARLRKGHVRANPFSLR